MYNETIKAENKIISSEDLTEIFQAMGETLKKYLRISQNEKIQNNTLDRLKQRYTFKDEGSKIKFLVNFYDNTNINFDNYDVFMGIFYSRLHEIKSINIRYVLMYQVLEPEPNRRRDYYTQSIDMYITENKMDITTNLKSDDPKLENVYNVIKTKILSAPTKYDEIIKKRKKITNTVAFGIGLIPGLIISAIPLFIPKINSIFFKGYVVYPICAIIISYIIGNVIASSKLDKYYEPIVPEKKRSGHDSNYNTIYKDDIKSFTGTSEILIGKKVDNLKNRKIIDQEYQKYKAILKKEIIAFLAITLIVIIIGIIL